MLTMEGILPGWNVPSYSFNEQLVCNLKTIYWVFFDSALGAVSMGQGGGEVAGTGHLEGNFLPCGFVASMALKL